MSAFSLERIKGSIPPLITPFRNGAVDHDAYADLVQFQLDEGTHGILVNGTTSEPSALTVQERNRQVDVTLRVAGGKVPVVAATGSQSLAETQETYATRRQRRSRRIVDRHPLLLQTPAAWFGRVLPEGDGGAGHPVDDLPHSRTHGGQCDVGHAQGTQAALPEFCRHETRGQRPRFCLVVP